MTRVMRAPIQIWFRVRMEPRLAAVLDDIDARGVCEPKHAPSGLVARGAHNGNALGEHDLVAVLGMQVDGGEEAGLGRVGVDPAEDKEVVFVEVVEEQLFVRGAARVAGRLLVRDGQMRNEEGIVLELAAQHAASF